MQNFQGRQELTQGGRKRKGTQEVKLQKYREHYTFLLFKVLEKRLTQ